jgi:hypothetical protein
MGINSFMIKSFKQTTVFLIGILIFTGCNKTVDINNFDEAAWKADKNSCLEKRGKLVDDLLSERKELIDLTQQEIVATLGMPEKQELYTRGQKFFIYHLTPGPDCESKSLNSEKEKLLYIRFSALNHVSEIFIK